MRGKTMRRVLGWLLIGLAGLLGLVCFWMLVGPTVRTWQTEREIARFKRNPSQAGADALVETLQTHAATAEQGQRILERLLFAEIRTRSTYPAGLPVVVTVERPFPPDFQGVPQSQEEVWIDRMGQQQGGQRRYGGRSRTLYLHILDGSQANPGTYEATIRGTYSVELQRDSGLTKTMGLLRRLLRVVRVSVPTPVMWQPTRTYECEFEAPVEVTVVPKEQAEPIKLVSSARVDEAMQKAICMGTPGPLGGIYSSRGPASGSGPLNELSAIVYQDLPVAVAFRLDLYLSDGQELAPSIAYAQRLRCRAGDSGTFILPLAKSLVERPGTHTYTGTAVLTPDPNAAYEDPAIEAIWDGEIELPITLKIRGP